MSIPSFNAGRRALANSLDDILRRAYGAEYDCEEWHATLAAALGVGTSTLYSYLNGTAAYPAQLLGPLVRMVHGDCGAGYADAILHAVFGTEWEISPRHITPEDERLLGDTPAILQECGSAISATGRALADGQVTVAEAREVTEACRRARLALDVLSRRMQRAASATGGAR